MRFIRACGVGVVILALTGCTAQQTADPTPAVSTRTTTHPASTAAPLTVTSTIRTTVTNSTVTRTGTRTTSYAPPPATKEPAPVPGECPYLATGDVSLINGQRPGQTMIIAVKPYPICDFYRSDGGWMARIRVIEAATPQAARAAVDQHVPVADSSPADQPPGWTGGSMPTPDGIEGNPDVQSVYAVSKARTAIVAESNQAQTIKGRQMVIETVANLGL